MNSHAWRRASRLVLAGLLLTIFTHTEASATVIDLNLVAAATATDEGPQDGVFDAFAPFNFLSVNNNGFTSFRTALEFDIASVLAESTINAATLTMFVDFVEGTRQIELHGYAGDGTISLDDFSLDGVVASTTLNPPGGHAVLFDARAFLHSLVTSGEAFAGFNIREDPANPSNFIVLSFAAPRLSVDFTAQVPEPSGILVLTAGLFTVLCAKIGRGRKLDGRDDGRDQSGTQ
jgi:hypothetical protein